MLCAAFSLSHRPGRPHPPTSAFSSSYPSRQCLHRPRWRQPLSREGGGGREAEEEARSGGGRGRRNEWWNRETDGLAA